MSVELKPCPFCGGEARIECRDSGRGLVWWAKCIACPMNLTLEPSEAAAAEMWNRRAPVRAQQSSEAKKGE